MTSTELSNRMLELYIQLHELLTKVQEAGDAAYLTHDGTYQHALQQAQNLLGVAADYTIDAANVLSKHRIIHGEMK